jgi:molecular chaperone GrpE
MKKAPENDDISIDLETGEEIEMEEDEVSNQSLKQKLKQLRDELKAVQKERDEHLAGWQRSKADLVNFRKTVEEDRIRDSLRAKSTIITSILPVLDTFEAAMQDKSWEVVDKSWREGIERIANQFLKVLENEGVKKFACKGDVFDPNIHECISVVKTEEKKEDNTIAQVLQQGYRLHTELVRPAKVIVAQM